MRKILFIIALIYQCTVSAQLVQYGQLANAQAGEAITAPVWLYSTGGKYYKADADDVTKAATSLSFISAGADEYTQVYTSGLVLDWPTALIPLATYYLSGTAGAMTTTRPSTGYVQRLGVALDTFQFSILINQIEKIELPDGAKGDITTSDGGGAFTIAANAVTTSKINDDAVTAAKIVAGAVGSSEIATDAVESAEIATDAVGSAEIAANAVGSSEIATGAVGATDELATTGISAAAYILPNVTADVYGRITSITSAAIKASATLDFPSSASGVSATLTVTVTGAAAGDGVVIGAPNGSATNGVFFGWVSATNTVTVRWQNNTGTNNPASGTFNIIVVKY